MDGNIQEIEKVIDKKNKPHSSTESFGDVSELQEIRPRGRRSYAIYDSFEECIKEQDLLHQIDSWVSEYCERNNSKKIDTIFGKQLFSALKLNNKFSKGACSIEHFGDLLLTHYSERCSFESGRSITKATSVDSIFGTQLKNYFAG